MPAILTRRHSLIALSLILALLAIVGILYFFSGVLGKEERSYWPLPTMIYKVDGPVHNGHTVREVRRLEYRSATDWTDMVIESDPIESLALGAVRTTGSYMRLRDELIEEYDSITNDITTETVEEGTLFVPNAYLVPYHNFVEGPTISRAGTSLDAADSTMSLATPVDQNRTHIKETDPIDTLEVITDLGV